MQRDPAAPAASQRGRVAAADDHDVAQRRQVRQHAGEQRDQRRVDDDHPVLGVVDDVDQLLREQPQVERVQHRAHARHREVGHQVLGVVPHEGGDPLVAGDARGRRAARGPGGPPSAPTSAYEVRRGPSAVQVITSDEPCTVRPCSSSRDTCSGVSIIVLRMTRRYVPVARLQQPPNDLRLPRSAAIATSTRQPHVVPRTIPACGKRRLGLDLTPLRRRATSRLVFTASGVSALGSYITYVSIPYQVLPAHRRSAAGRPARPVRAGAAAVHGVRRRALADYLDRRLLVIVGELAFAALTAVLLVNALLGRPQLWLLFVVAGADHRDRRAAAAGPGRDHPAAGRTRADPGRQRAATRCA